MEWTYNQNGVTPAELTMMDVLVHNQWKRPIYFAFTVPESQRLGLDNYLGSEGFALRLMPVNAQEEPEVRERLVNTDALYGGIMNRFAWGNMNRSAYLDPTSRTLVGETIKIFSDTAEMLIAEGNIDAAKKIVNRATEVLPTKIYQPDIAVRYPVLADQLYTLGETEKANALVERNLKFLEEQMVYYAAIAETKSLTQSEAMGIRSGLFALQQFSGSAETHGQAAQYRQLQAVFDKYRKLFFEG